MEHHLLIYSQRKSTSLARAAPFVLTNPDFSKTEVVKNYAHIITVAPAIDHRKHTIEVKKGANEESAYFQPAACLGKQDLSV